MGQFEMSFAVSTLDSPIERKNKSFGERTSWGLTMRMLGNDLTTLVICSKVKPWFLRRARTESGLLEDESFTNRDRDLADSKDKPHEFTRYWTVKDFKGGGLFLLASSVFFVAETEEHNVLLLLILLLLS